MQQTRAKYDRLLEDLRTELRPQREWCEGRGIFMVLGHFVVGLAGGTWLFSLIYGLRGGLTLAFLLAGLGGLLHLANLGRPSRAWKMMLQWRRSWVARGFIGLAAFLAGAVFALAPLYVPQIVWAADSVIARAGNALALAGALVMIGYMGFVYTASKGVPFWSTPLHPALYVAYALRGGIAVVLVVLAAGGGGFAHLADLLALWCAVTALASALYGLELHGALTGGSPAARQSAHELVAGRVAVYFYGGTLLVGLVVPGLLVWTGLNGPLSVGAMALLGSASALGDFFMKYATIRAGIYMPVWPSFAPRR